MKDLKYLDIIKLNKENFASGGVDVKLALLSNTMVHYAKEIIEYGLRKKGFDPIIYIGDYDNILQESANLSNSDIVCIFWEASNLIDGFEYKVNSLSPQELKNLKEKVIGEIQLTLENLKGHSLVLFNRFSVAPFRPNNLRSDSFMIFVDELNTALERMIPPNTKLIELSTIYNQVSVQNAINLRDYFSSKTLYTTDFFKAYAVHTLPFFSSIYGKAKKALIFDCDNTLWKGVLGEDGFEGIQMSSKTKGGVVYEAVQYMALELSKRGVIIGLCSKNNHEDVERVIDSHPDFILNQADIVIKKVNWNNKASNLSEIANELNIGLDSIVFVDDSDFEVNLIRQELPEIEAVQVPKKAHEYPSLIRQTMELFFNASESKEDATKTAMYKQQAIREEAKTSFADIEAFLSSLELELELHINEPSIIPRISQMTQKTNQFNFTTKRYTEQDIQSFYEDANSDVIAMSVRDKFGDSGVVGLLIAKKSVDAAEIDTFLMSCRVLGRNIEYKFIDMVIHLLAEMGINKIRGTYLPTNKNAQVRNLYEKFGFSLNGDLDMKREYQLKVSDYKGVKLDYIKVRIDER